MSRYLIAASAFIAGAAVMIAYSVRAEPSGQPAVPVAAQVAPGDADREAILKSASAFAAAFNKGDAKALASMYTENAESRDATGRTLVGRAEIEKVYAELFKANSGAKIEVLVNSVRFPAKDMAVEEGLVRFTHSPKDLPATSAYVVIHSREDGQWKIALSSEGGVGEYRLEDLDWLLGKWTTKSKDAMVTLSFVRDPKKPVITGTFTRTPNGQESVSSSTRIALDPETGQIRSWVFEDDGSHSQALWHRDGKSWILDMRGVLADGTPTDERIILQRVSADVITWRAVDRVVDEELLPDTSPLRLTRETTK